MRSCSILRIGLIVSATLYCASSVEIVVRGGRNRGEQLRHGTTLPEASRSRSDGAHVHPSRSLGVGLDNLKYGNTKGQHHKDSKAKGKVGGNIYATESTNTEDSVPSRGKGSGKGYVSSGSIDSDDIHHPAPTKTSFIPPTMYPGSKKPTHPRKKDKSSKNSTQTKLHKSDKGSPTSQPAFQPTRPPTLNEPTPSDTSSDNIIGLLSPYTILYTVTDDERPPFRSELLEVVELTRIYLNSFFLSNFKKSELTYLSKVMTLFTNTGFEFGEAIPIDYESRAAFESSSIIIPDKEDLDKVLVSAFEGDNLDGYIGLLQSLPTSNIFSSTQYAKLVQMTEESSTMNFEVASSNSIARNLTLGSIVVGGVAGLLLIFASTNIARRKTKRKNDRTSVLGKKSSTSIAGETFATRASSRQNERMFTPICKELYSDDTENRR